ncbi:hypothetical protein HELRODRAFT_172916 [Helobdella robusta]|uniref:Uncharacterized protein n=1 Tax=Helobdella robusta TaxID=6412 RepID=T1F645_HELRO|nr:hypothetical protein HELRODRAFT_172916 [Helobdella robusta]ESO03889.1 hypothetical protein HELRODRAFT_172916 [Helobdella robusta]
MKRAADAQLNFITYYHKLLPAKVTSASKEIVKVHAIVEQKGRKPVLNTLQLKFIIEMKKIRAFVSLLETKHFQQLFGTVEVMILVEADKDGDEDVGDEDADDEDADDEDVDDEDVDDKEADDKDVDDENIDNEDADDEDADDEDVDDEDADDEDADDEDADDEDADDEDADDEDADDEDADDEDVNDRDDTSLKLGPEELSVTNIAILTDNLHITFNTHTHPNTNTQTQTEIHKLNQESTAHKKA